MKTKHLAMENGDLTGSSIGDQMSAMAAFQGALILTTS